MRRALAVAGLAVGLALATSALAREKGEGRKKRGKQKQATGTFVSAELAGEVVNWKLALDEEGEKTFEMAAQVGVLYSEKNDRKRARRVFAIGKKMPQPRGKMQVAQGKFVKAEMQGRKVVVTLKVGEGAEAADQDFALPSRLAVRYRDRAGTLTATSIGPGGRGKGREKKQEGEGKKRKRKREKVPENM